MWFPKNIPIRRKLTLVILVSCTAALLVASMALFAFQLITFRQSFTRDLSALAEIIARNSTAALTFKDKEAAEEILSALKAKPHLLCAAIALPDDSVFARFGGDLSEATLKSLPKAKGYRFEGYDAYHFQPIILDGEQIGMLYLRSDYGQVYASLLRLYALILTAVFAISFLFAFIVSARLQKVISGPILKLAETAKVIAEKNDYSVRAEKIEQDEVGSFTDAFNRMLEQIQSQDAELQTAQHKLAEQVTELQHEIAERKRAESELELLHKQLLETSRHAGMAEVATSVLHNVGNVLNSVNVSTSLVCDNLRKSKSQNLAKAANLLQEHTADLGTFLTSDPKGQLLPKYLADLSDHLATEQEDMLTELELLSKNIEHIKDIVAMQQSYAKVSGFVEAHAADKLVEDALHMNAAAFVRHGVELLRDYSPVPMVAVDKHKVLQILVNVMRNAKYALDDGGREDKRLVLSIGMNGNDRVKLSVIDNGVGIAPENLTKIFSHGFTTKKDGHGFGLHSGALAAKEMGGRLIAYSDGLGKGATFTLELPIVQNTTHEQSSD